MAKEEKGPLVRGPPQQSGVRPKTSYESLPSAGASTHAHFTPWAFRYTPCNKEERFLALYESPDERSKVRHHLALRKGGLVTVLAVVQCTPGSEWARVQWRGQAAGWAQRISSSGETRLARVDTYKRYEAWRGSNRFYLGGRIMLGPNVGVFLFSNACITLPTLAIVWLVCPKFPNPTNIILAATAGALWAVCVALLWTTALVEPGILPRNPEPADGVPPINGALGFRHCETCNICRPPRGKHCRQCDNCIDLFDHHCPWTASCIGGRNYRYFFSFLVFTTMTATYLLVLCSLSLAAAGRRRADELGLQHQKAGVVAVEAIAAEPFLCVVMLFGFVTLCSVLNLLGYHILITCLGQTTNERVLGVFRRNPNANDQGCTGNYRRAFFEAIPPSRLPDMTATLSGEGGVEGDMAPQRAVSGTIVSSRSARVVVREVKDEDSVASSLTEDDPSLDV